MNALPLFRHHRALHLLALLAALALALVPSLSRAWAAPGATAVAVCTAEGTRWVMVDVSGSAPRTHGTVLDACGLCLLALQGLAPPAQGWTWERPVRAALVLPRSASGDAGPVPPWRPDRARAPPLPT